MRRIPRGWSRLEALVVLIVLLLLAGLLLQRLQGVGQQARSVQLQMAAENARINAQLLFLRCAGALDPACWQAAQQDLRRISLRPGVDPRNPSLPDPEPRRAGPATVSELLHTIARAAGLGQHPQAEGDWRWQPEGDQTLHLSLEGVPHCRFSLIWQGAERPVSVQDVQSVCQ